MLCKYFLPCYFTFLRMSLIHIIFNFNGVYLPTLPCCLCFWCRIQGIIARSNVMKVFPYVFFQGCRSFSFYVWVFDSTSFLPVHVGVQLSQLHTLKRRSASPWSGLGILVRSQLTVCESAIAFFGQFNFLKRSPSGKVTFYGFWGTVLSFTPVQIRVATPTTGRQSSPGPPDPPAGVLLVGASSPSPAPCLAPWCPGLVSSRTPCRGSRVTGSPRSVCFADPASLMSCGGLTSPRRASLSLASFQQHLFTSVSVTFW